MRDDLDDSAYAELLAHTVLNRLGEPFGAWTILDVSPLNEDLAPPRPGLSRVELLHIRFRTATGEEYGVYFSPGCPRNEASVTTAGQIQDHVVESVEGWGVALPPCPGHPHPLDARLVDSVPMWVCPKDSRHHAEPILPEIRQW